MIYWYTGQPGHGKTLHAIDHAMDFRDQGRLVYVCNVRGFKHDEARMLPMTPEQFIDWPNSLPDGSVVLVDEAYEHGMLPKRPPSAKVPEHVKELAKHRHRGLDFIFVSQSPKKQIDEFVHDLIERHVHVRRRFMLPFAHLRIFDQFEERPQKGHPLILKRVKLPKRPMGLYESTVMDTSERAIPWYYPAAAALLLAVVGGAWWSVNRVHDQLSGQVDAVNPTGLAPQAAENGAGATVAAAPQATPPAVSRSSDYVAWMRPRVQGQPWTAPAYDSLAVPTNQPPRVYCMASGDGLDAMGEHQIGRCGCKTEQGTTYVMDQEQCRLVAREGQYEPFLDTNQAEARRMEGLQQSAHYQQEARYEREAVTGSTISKQARALGSFPESPVYTSSTSVTPPTTRDM